MRYDVARVQVMPKEERRTHLKFRDKSLPATEYVYTVMDENYARPHRWEFLVRVPDAAHVQQVERECDDEEEEDRARPSRRVLDPVSLGVEEDGGTGSCRDHERREELGRRRVAHRASLRAR